MTGLVDCEFGGIAETVRFARPGDELVWDERTNRVSRI
jgi:hypothetical protein